MRGNRHTAGYKLSRLQLYFGKQPYKPSNEDKKESDNSQQRLPKNQPVFSLLK